MRRNTTSRVSLTLLFSIVFLMLISGCVTVNSQPFGEFLISVQELRKGADAALHFNDEENRKWFLNKAAEDIGNEGSGTAAITGLAIKGEEFSWSMDPTPLFMTSKRFRKGVYRFNTVFMNYSELLESISASELVDVKQFDKMAGDLNANMKSATKAMKVTVPEEAGEGMAIFSAAASAAARIAVEHKRKNKLLEALQTNQEQIKKLSLKLQEAILIATENLWEIYEDHKRILFKELVEVSKKSKAERKKRVEKFLKWNEDFVYRLSVLESLHHAYGTLPNAHKELSEALKKPNLSLYSIRELYEEGKHIYALYKDLSKEE